MSDNNQKSRNDLPILNKKKPKKGTEFLYEFSPIFRKIISGFFC